MSDIAQTNNRRVPSGFRREKGKPHPLYIFSGSYQRVPELVQGQDLETYERMLGDPSVIAAYRSIELPILRATYDVEYPTEPTELERLQTKIIKEAFFEYLSWPEMLKGAITYLYNGFSVQEYTLEVREYENKQYVLPRTVSFRPAHTVNEEPGSRNAKGRLRELIQTVDGRRYTLPRRQLIICSMDTPSIEYWRGRSLLYAAYKPWFIKEKMEIINSISHERWAAGIPYAEMPALEDLQAAGIEIDGESGLYAKAEQALRKLHAGEQSYAVAPPGWKLSILDRRGNPTDPLPFIKELKEDIYISVLAGHLRLGGAETSGSKALGVTFVEMFLNAVESWGQGICDSFNRDAIRPICDFNWGRLNRYPRMTVTNILKAAVEKLAYLIQTGAIPATRELVKFIYDQYNINIDVDAIQITNTNYRSSNQNNNNDDNQDQPQGEDNNAV